MAPPETDGVSPLTSPCPLATLDRSSGARTRQFANHHLNALCSYSAYPLFTLRIDLDFLLIIYSLQINNYRNS